MSHYIHASYPTGESELSAGGFNLRAMSRTGFDFYAAYSASIYDAFWSGAGGVVKLSHSAAKKAFLKLFAWAFALEEYSQRHKELLEAPETPPPELQQAGSIENDQQLVEWAKAVAESYQEEASLKRGPRPVPAQTEQASALEEHLKEVGGSIRVEVSERD